MALRNSKTPYVTIRRLPCSKCDDFLRCKGQDPVALVNKLLKQTIKKAACKYFACNIYRSGSKRLIWNFVFEFVPAAYDLASHSKEFIKRYVKNPVRMRPILEKVPKFFTNTNFKSYTKKGETNAAVYVKNIVTKPHRSCRRFIRLWSPKVKPK